MQGKKVYFTPGTCKGGSYNCRVLKQYLRIVSETGKLRQMFNGVYSMLLQAIDHMEYHPTVGKEKKGSSVRLQKRSTGQGSLSLAQQLRSLSGDDIKML